MKTYTFEHTDYGLIKKTVIFSMLAVFGVIAAIFLLFIGTKSLYLDYVAIPVLVIGLVVIIYFALRSIKKLKSQFKKAKLHGTATITDDTVELRLYNLNKTIAFKDLKSYKIEIHQNSRTELKLHHSGGTDYIHADDMYCNAEAFNPFCAALDGVLSEYQFSQNIALQEKSVIEQPWVLFMLFVITVLILALSLYTDITSSALFVALGAVWTAYFGTRVLRKH